jgi:hypothetical protein
VQHKSSLSGVQRFSDQRFSGRWTPDAVNACRKIAALYGTQKVLCRHFLLPRMIT